jgi:hypothetical protein
LDRPASNILDHCLQTGPAAAAAGPRRVIGQTRHSDSEGVLGGDSGDANILIVAMPETSQEMGRKAST